MQSNRLLTPDEVVDVLRLDDRADPLGAVAHLRRCGRLRGIKVSGRWRYRASDVEAYLKRCEVSSVV